MCYTKLAVQIYDSFSDKIIFDIIIVTSFFTMNLAVKIWKICWHIQFFGKCDLYMHVMLPLCARKYLLS